MPHHYIYIGPFEKGALESDRDWIAAARATLSVEHRYKIFTTWNRELRRDHFLLLLFSPHATDSDDEVRRLLRDALTALRGHWEDDTTHSVPSFYVLPSFNEPEVREPTALYRLHQEERQKTTTRSLRPS